MQKTRFLYLFSFFVLFTFALTPFASAEWKQNTITNSTPERVFVVYSTWRGADAAKQIPRGYRTVGHYAIDPSASRTFWAWANNSIYFRITKSRIPQKPQRDATTVSHWIHPTRAFTAASATIGGTRPTYSTIDSSDLVNSDGFLKYQNGSQITVNNTWVDINEPPEDTRPSGDGEDAPGGTTAGDLTGKTATVTRQTSYSGRRISIFDDNYWYDKTFEFTFPGKVVSHSLRFTTYRVNVDEKAVRVSGNTVSVPVRIQAKTFPVATIELWVTATYEVSATATKTLHIKESGRRIGLFDDNYWYDKTFEFTFPGKVVSHSWRSETWRANVDKNAVRASGNTVSVPVRIQAKTFPVATIELWVTATYEVTAPSPGAPSLHSQFGPETQQLPAFWQDLSQVPEKTALLPNYPNPFNPETWIPFGMVETTSASAWRVGCISIPSPLETLLPRARCSF